MTSKIDPANLKITDMRFADIDGAPQRDVAPVVLVPGITQPRRRRRLPAVVAGAGTMVFRLVAIERAGKIRPQRAAPPGSRRVRSGPGASRGCLRS